MFGIFGQDRKNFKELLLAASINLESMFDINDKVGSCTDVGKLPMGWNGCIYFLSKALTISVIIPIAGLIIVTVLIELINMVMQKNNMHDTDTLTF